MLAADYLDQLQQLLPRGAAWPRDADAPLTLLLDAIAQELARVDARGLQLIEEADPRTALELLPDWERLVGLPDPCAGTIATTVPERRAAILAKLTAAGGQSIAYLTTLAETLGFTIAITEFVPSRAGAFHCGDQLADPDWASAFRVDVLPGAASSADIWLRAGSGRVGDRIRSFGSTALECVLRRARPAHTTAIFAYPVSEPVFSFDFTA